MSVQLLDFKCLMASFVSSAENDAYAGDDLAHRDAAVAVRYSLAM
jgi:hypothetical protein